MNSGAFSFCPSWDRRFEPYGEDRESRFPFQRISVLIQPYSAILLRQSFRRTAGITLTVFTFQNLNSFKIFQYFFFPSGTHIGWSHSSREKTAISLKRGKIWPRSLLMINRKSHTRFRLVPKSMTLDDLEWPLCTLFQNTCVSEPITKIWTKQTRIISETLVSGNIRFMWIFAGIPWRRGVKRQWGNRKRRFSGLSDASSSAR